MTGWTRVWTFRVNWGRGSASQLIEIRARTERAARRELRLCHGRPESAMLEGRPRLESPR